jgi:hypothetical protein
MEVEGSTAPGETSLNPLTPNVDEVAPFSTFTKFPELPVEIRLNIWAHACHQPRNIGLWADFQRCEVENTIFYTQIYDTKLTPVLSPPIVQVSQEARNEAFKHCQYEFETQQALTIRGSSRPMVIVQTGFCFNFECQTLCPRGNWNIISMEDFIVRRTNTQLRYLGMDITSDFYKQLYKDYITKNTWPFRVMEEVTLYDGTGMPVFKKHYKGGKVEFEFVEIENPSSLLKDAKEKLCGKLAELAEKIKAGRSTMNRPSAEQEILSRCLRCLV